MIKYIYYCLIFKINFSGFLGPIYLIFELKIMESYDRIHTQSCQLRSPWQSSIAALSLDAIFYAESSFTLS